MNITIHQLSDKVTTSLSFIVAGSQSRDSTHKYVLFLENGNCYLQHIILRSPLDVTYVAGIGRGLHLFEAGKYVHCSLVVIILILCPTAEAGSRLVLVSRLFGIIWMWRRYFEQKRNLLYIISIQEVPVDGLFIERGCAGGWTGIVARKIKYCQIILIHPLNPSIRTLETEHKSSTLEAGIIKSKNRYRIISIKYKSSKYAQETAALLLGFEPCPSRNHHHHHVYSTPSNKVSNKTSNNQEINITILLKVSKIVTKQDTFTSKSSPFGRESSPSLNL